MKNELIRVCHIQDVLLDMGIPANLRGFMYICQAEERALAAGECCLRNLSKGLYTELARAHNTTPSNVERCIRHAVSVAWSLGDVDTLNRIFKNSINPYRGVPTNAQFLLRIYYYIANNNYYD